MKQGPPRYEAGLLHTSLQHFVCRFHFIFTFHPVRSPSETKI
jgi:hypothetical protein